MIAVGNGNSINAVAARATGIKIRSIHTAFLGNRQMKAIENKYPPAITKLVSCCVNGMGVRPNNDMVVPEKKRTPICHTINGVENNSSNGLPMRY